MSMKIIDSSNEIKKRKQKLVKHKRKNWKKTDITEIEKRIDDLKQQERTGGIRSDKKDAELFFVDKENLGSETNKKKFKSEKDLSLEIKLNKLRCYRNLLPDPNNTVPAHIINPLRAKIPDSKRTLKKENLDDEKAKRKFKKLEKVTKSFADDINKIVKSTNKLIEFNKDLWDDSNKPVVNEVNEYYLRSTKKLPVKKPKTFDNKPSALPAMEVPHPGTSYNPSYEDHQDLLLNAHVVELDKLKKEERRIRNLDSKIPKMTAGEIEKLWIQEMSGDLLKSEDDDDDDDGDDKNNAENELKKQTNEKKMTKKQKTRVQKKRTALIEKLKEKEKENLKQKRIQENEIFRLKSIKKEITKKEEEQKNKIEKRKLEKKQKALYGQKRISSLKYTEPELDLKLSDELTGNLRNMKPEGNILYDRYKSLQKRNIIETRDKAKRFKKYWTKKYDKKGVKEITV